MSVLGHTAWSDATGGGARGLARAPETAHLCVIRQYQHGGFVLPEAD